MSLRRAFPKKPKPLMIAVGGVTGTGKSTLAHALCLIIDNAIYLDSDVLRKKLNGVDPLTTLPDDAYSPEKLDVFLRYVRDETKKALKTHDVVIVTGTFEPKSRLDQEQFAHDCGARFNGLYLRATYKTLYNRVASRTDTASDANLQVLERQTKHLNAPHNKRSWITVDAEQPFERVVHDALKALEKLEKRRPKKLKKPASPLPGSTPKY